MTLCCCNRDSGVTLKGRVTLRMSGVTCMAALSSSTATKSYGFTCIVVNVGDDVVGDGIVLDSGVVVLLLMLLVFER